MTGAWIREVEPDHASERILDAAGRVFGKIGVSAAGMAEIAEAAGCSRGTLYRYFPNRHALHLAYVEREARAILARVQEETAGITDPAERLTAHVLISVRLVRERQGTAAWFAPAAEGLGARMSRAPEIGEALARAFGDSAVAGAHARAGRLRVRWLVRVIVSLLTDPGESAAEERALVERFVVPALLADASARGAARGRG